MMPVPCTDQAISDFEAGQTGRMQSRKWMRIAEVFKMSVQELNDRVFGGDKLDSIVLTFQAEDAKTIEEYAKKHNLTPTAAAERMILDRIAELRKSSGMKLSLVEDSPASEEVAAIPTAKPDADATGDPAPLRQQDKPRPGRTPLGVAGKIGPPTRDKTKVAAKPRGNPPPEKT